VGDFEIKMVTRKDGVSCEVNSIGATGVQPPLLGRTTICIGAKTNRSAQNYIMNGSDYAGLPGSSPWPYQIVTIVAGQIEKEKMGIPLDLITPFCQTKNEKGHSAYPPSPW
jgi:hypothetical protein